MILLKRIAAGAVALPLLSVAAASEPQLYELDPSHMSIVFNADHIGYGATWGMFLRGSGSFMFDEDAMTVSDLKVEVDTSSVFSNDNRRDGHLRSGDFLDVDNFPVATFVMTGNEQITDDSGTITGDLTLLGQTHPVVLDVTLNKIGPYPWGDNYVVGVTAKTVINRSEWGMTYAVADGLVGDEVPLIIEVEAIRQDGDA
ncbi:MAG: YceI family protein [Pseudomonadota bacterium]